MNKFYTILLLMGISVLAKAQVSGKHMGSTGVGGDLSIQNNDGKMIPIGAKADTKGTPLFSEDWTPGTILFKNGVKINNPELNFSLYEDRLYFRRDNQFYIIDGIISEFYLGLNDSTKITHFVSGYPSTGNTNENTFFQLIADGSHYQLLKWQHKKIRDIYSYGGTNETEYVNQEGYFVYQKASKKLVGLGNKPNALQIKSTLSVDDATWKAYLDNHMVNAKSEKAMIDMITYLNGL